MNHHEELDKIIVPYREINHEPSNQVTMIILKATNQAIQAFLEEHDLLTRGVWYVSSIFEPKYYQLDLIADGPTISKQWFDSSEGLRVCTLYISGPYYSNDNASGSVTQIKIQRGHLSNAVKSITRRIFDALERAEAQRTGNYNVSVETITLPFNNEKVPIYHYKKVKNETQPMSKLEIIKESDIEKHLKESYDIPSLVYIYIEELRKG